ncbi:ubiquitin-like protein 7 [Dendroctonus ponderosae]
MALNVYLGIWSEDKLRRIRVDDLDVDSNVEVLKLHLVKELGNSPCELTFCGLHLEDGKPISTYGITPGVTIHVTEKLHVKQANISEPTKITESDIQELVSSYRNFKSLPSYRSTLHRLENPSELDKVIAAVPGLESDEIAIAFISKPDLFTQMDDPKTCRQIGERHPCILAAARYIVTEFHKSTTLTSTSTLQPPPSTGHSYSLDALSDDDEEMEGDGPSSDGATITAAHLAAALAEATAEAAASTTATRSAPTTTAHLAAALAQAASAAAARSAGSSAPVTAAPSGAAAESSSAARITNEMLQQAFTPTIGYGAYLSQMRELGLNNEVLNLRALMAAGGDLQAAIELVFSGALDD